MYPGMPLYGLNPLSPPGQHAHQAEALGQTAVRPKPQVAPKLQRPTAHGAFKPGMQSKDGISKSCAGSAPLNTLFFVLIAMPWCSCTSLPAAMRLPCCNMRQKQRAVTEGANCTSQQIIIEKPVKLSRSAWSREPAALHVRGMFSRRDEEEVDANNPFAIQRNLKKASPISDDLSVALRGPRRVAATCDAVDSSGNQSRPSEPEHKPSSDEEEYVPIPLLTPLLQGCRIVLSSAVFASCQGLNALDQLESYCHAPLLKFGSTYQALLPSFAAFLSVGPNKLSHKV